MRRLAALSALLALAAGAGAQVSAAQGSASTASGAPDALSPALLSGFQLDAGFLNAFGKGTDNRGYYRLLYQGSPVRQAGTPIAYASHLNLAVPALKAGGGDTSKLALRFEQGTLKGEGGVFDLLGVQELRLRGLESLRGSATLNADDDFDHLALAVGLETPPFRVPGLAGTPVTNWVVFGLNAQRQEDTDAQEDASDANQGLVTARGFVGKAFGWRPSADVAKTAAGLARVILDATPTKEAAKATFDAIVVAGGGQVEPFRPPMRQADLSDAQILLYDSYLDYDGDPKDSVAWAAYIREAAKGRTEAKDQPTTALLAEGSAWYTFSGGTGPRLRGLFSVTGTYWFLPARDDLFVQARYELGYERANPTLRKNNLILSVGLRF